MQEEKKCNNDGYNTVHNVNKPKKQLSFHIVIHLHSPC